MGSDVDAALPLPLLDEALSTVRGVDEAYVSGHGQPASSGSPARSRATWMYSWWVTMSRSEWDDPDSGFVAEIRDAARVPVGRSAAGGGGLSDPSRSMKAAVTALGEGTTLSDLRTEQPLYTYRQAARYPGVPASTFATWARGYERTFPDRDQPVIKGPIITATDAPAGQPRVPFVGLAEGMVVAAFRRRGLPMQPIRPAVKVLQEEIGLEHALASRNLYSDGAEILFDFADRYDEDEFHRLVVVRSGQHVFHEVVRDYLERISYDEADGLARRLFLPITRERLIQVDPALAFGQPLFIHGGAPLDSIRSRVKAGEPIRSVARDFEVPEAELREALSAAA